MEQSNLVKIEGAGESQELDQDLWLDEQERASAVITEQPAERPPAAEYPIDESPVHMLPDEEIGELKNRWELLQLKFVDEPRESVELANDLICSLLNRLEQIHDEQGTRLVEHSQNGGISTEDLRLTLQRYRLCFEHLVET